MEGRRLIRQDPAKLLDAGSEFLSAFTLVICSNVDPAIELRVADQLWERALLANYDDDSS
jgi:hypothetical protein